MNAGTHVVMTHPQGYATITGSGGRFIGWIPNGVAGTVYLLTPDREHALVNFDGKLLATVPLAHLRPAPSVPVAPAA